MRSALIVSVSIGLVLVAASCNKPSDRLNAPPQGACDYPSPLQESFAYMVDNAMLEDLSLADIHFVPHSDELNGTGARRLDRYAKLLTVYGGSIRYATSLTDDRLVEARMNNIRGYLATTGIASERIKISRDLPGGVGMTAREAIVAKANSAAFSSEASKGGKGGGQSDLTSLVGGASVGGQ